jgi:serine/threonine protein phosphatase PrpC
MDLRIASLTDVGRARTNNEDSLLADVPLVAVADGMGGHRGGEVASGIAIDVLKGWKDKLEGLSGREAADKLKDAIAEANRVVHARGQEDETLQGMGTTLTAGWLIDRTLSLAHVGDSRAYLLRGRKLRQLTEDQNVAQQLVRRGRISEEEAATSPHRHILLQAIGADTELEVETMTVELQPGDRLIINSDGLSGMIRDEDIERILTSQTDPDVAARELIDAANEAGGGDNISVILVDVPGDPAAVAAAEEPDEELVIDRGAAAAPKSRRRIPRGGLIAAGAVLVLAAMAVLFLTRSTAPNYVVSTRDGIIVVLDGDVGNATTPARGEVVQEFANEKLTEFPSPVQRRFRTGLEVESIEEARSLVARQPHVKGPRDTPTPEPKTPRPSPTASAGAEPAPSPGASG